MCETVSQRMTWGWGWRRRLVREHPMPAFNLTLVINTEEVRVSEFRGAAQESELAPCASFFRRKR